MKAKISMMTFLFIITFSCQERMEKNSSLKDNADKEETKEGNLNEERITTKDNFEIPHVEVITAELPIKLASIDFENKNLVQQVSDGKMNGIEEEIKNYYLNDCGGSKEHPYSRKDVYLKTIQINNKSNYILYWIIFKHTTGMVNSRILFYDNTKKEFSEYVHDLNVHGLYNEEDRKIIPSNLKELFRIDFSEIEIVDFDKDEITDFRLRRLYHNGTANAIEEMIIEVNQTDADTLKFEREWIQN